MSDQQQPQPAPEGFELDETMIEASAMAIFDRDDADLAREIRAGRIAWAAELDENRIVVVNVIDKGTGAALGTLALDWRDAGTVSGT